MSELIWCTSWEKADEDGKRKTWVSREGREVILSQMVDYTGKDVGRDASIYLDTEEALLATAMACLRALEALHLRRSAEGGTA